MSVDGGVTSGTSQVFVLSVWDVQVGLWIAELLGKTEIDDVDLVATLADSHEEVIWLNVAVNEIARMDVLDARDLRCHVHIRTQEISGEPTS